MRRYGGKIVKNIKYRDRPGAYGILVRDDQVLLTHQAFPNPEFQLPGGGIEQGETPIQALHREVREETGWRIDVHARLGCYQRYTYMSEYDLWARKICHIFLCRPARKVHNSLEAHHTNHWLSFEQACHRVSNEGDQDFLLSVLKP